MERFFQYSSRWLQTELEGPEMILSKDGSKHRQAKWMSEVGIQNLFFGYSPGRQLFIHATCLGFII
jgi:hypothetical protein